MGGVRLEDTILITEGAPENLSEGAPRTSDEIEAVMAAGLTKAKMAAKANPAARITATATTTAVGAAAQE